MNELKRIIKKKILCCIELLPFGRDIYLLFAKNRLGISYRGVFGSFKLAQSAVKTDINSHYDIVNANKAADIDRERLHLDNWFHDSDYPLLFWLSKLLVGGKTILELGGSIGHFFYSTQKYNPCPEGIKWTISELHEAVNLGQKIAKDRHENRLSFVESSEMPSIDPVDIFMTSGTLQYMDASLPKILRSLKTLPNHVLVHNLPVHTHKSFWTVQNLQVCEVPYQIYSKEELENSMCDLGYTIVASWKKDRSIEIPFQHDTKIEGYLGYYFLLSSNTSSNDT